MATGTFAARPGGFAVKTAAQILTRRAKINASQNLVDGALTAGVLSCRSIHTGGVCSLVANPDATNNGLTDQTPVITETYFAEVVVPYACTVTGIAVHNGSDVTGNTLVGLADSAGVILGTSASTAGSGTDGYQRIPFSAAITIAPGTYFVCVQHSSGTARAAAHTFGNFATGKTTGETYGTMSNITPTTTFTTAIGPVASLY